MDHSSMTRIECFEETHEWTIENWKTWLKVSSFKPSKDKHELSALLSEKFCVPYADNQGSIQTTIWQLKAFPEKDRHGKNTLKLKLVNHNGNCYIPPGTFDIKSEPLISFHSLVCFGFHWHGRPLDNTKAQFPVPHRWPKKNLKISVMIKIFVPISLRSTLPDIVSDNKMLKPVDQSVYVSPIKNKDSGDERNHIPIHTKSNVHNQNQTNKLKTKCFEGNKSSNQHSTTEDNDSLATLRIPSAPSLMEPV